MQDKMPKNKQGQAHGLWELYWANKHLLTRINYVNDIPHGLFEKYWSDNEPLEFEYYAP